MEQEVVADFGGLCCCYLCLCLLGLQTNLNLLQAIRGQLEAHSIGHTDILAVVVMIRQVLGTAGPTLASALAPLGTDDPT